MHNLYILYNKEKDFVYAGSTNDLERRLAEHNAGSSKSTKAYRPLKLGYFEEHKTLNEVRGREAEIKSWKSRSYLAEKLRLDL
jgi:putative endonuclease